MYNRYIRAQEDSAAQDAPPHQAQNEPPKQEAANPGSQLLRRLLGKLHMEHVDTGDIILLLLLFFLFEEQADDELLIALGLLLIL